MKKIPSETAEKKQRKPKKELESRSFRDGAIYLFKRADYKKPTWFCRVKIPGAKGYLTQSTKTTDEHAAYKFADDLFHKGLGRVASGQEINSKKLSVAINEFVDGYSEAERKKPTAITRAQFLKRSTGFFGGTRLKEVSTKTLAELNDWIVANSRRGSLSPNTLKRYTTDLKVFFNWCLERGYIEALPRYLPSSRRRPSIRSSQKYGDQRRYVGEALWSHKQRGVCC